MSTTEELIEQKKEMLERRAKVVRSRLLRAVDALDARRHQVERIAETAKEVTPQLLLGGAAVVALFGLSAWSFGKAVKRRRRLSFVERLAENVRDLDLVPRPSFSRRLAEKVTLALASYAVTEVARRVTHNVVDGRLLDGRLAVAPALEAHHSELNP